MCDPGTLAIGATVFGVGSDLKASRDAKQTGVANARIAAIMAEDTEQRGLIAEERHRGQVRQLIGKQRAAIGGKNLVLSGTPLDLLLDTAQLGEEDALQLRENAFIEALGIRTQGAQALRQGKNASKQALFSAAGTLLTGGSKILETRRLAEGTS